MDNSQTIQSEVGKQRVFFHAVCAGVLVFLCYFACFWGIPFDFSWDLHYMYDSTRHTGIGLLVQELLDPRTPAWFYLEDFKYLRPVQFLLLTILQRWKLLDLPWVHLVGFFGLMLLTVALFLMLWRISRSKWFAWLGVMLYATFPIHVYSMVSITPIDWQFYELFFVLCSVMLFWKVLTDPDISGIRSGFSLAAVAFMTLLAINLKSSAKVLPCIFLALIPVAWRWKRSSQKFFRRRRRVALLTVLAMFVMVVPLATHASHPDRKDRRVIKPNWEFALQRTFYSRPGTPLALMTLRRDPPGSLTECYGFFMGWIFWGALAIALARRWKGDRPASPLFWPSLIWFLFSLAGFALGEPPLDLNNRYLTYGLLPSVVLLFTCLFSSDADTQSSHNNRATDGFRSAWKWILSACILVTIFQNLFWFQRWSEHFAGFQWALVESEKAIFADVRQRVPVGHEELFEFHSRSRNDKMIMEWEWDPKEIRQATLDRLRKNGSLYYLGRGEEMTGRNLSQKDGVIVVWRKKISLYDAPTLAMRCAKMLRTRLKKDGQGNDIVVFKLRAALPP